MHGSVEKFRKWLGVHFLESQCISLIVHEIMLSDQP